MSGLRRPNPSRETKFSGASGDKETLIFPVQLTTSRIGNLTRLIHTLAICGENTYILYDNELSSSPEWSIIVGNLHTCYNSSAQVVSSILVKAGFLLYSGYYHSPYVAESVST